MRLRRWDAVLSVLPYQHWQIAFLAACVNGADAEHLIGRLLEQDDPLDTGDVERLAEELVQAATGWPWYAAARLAGWVVSEWSQASGALRLRGVDVGRMVRAQPALALNATYALLVEHADAKARLGLDAELMRPPPGVAPKQGSVDEDAALFLRAMREG